MPTGKDFTPTNRGSTGKKNANCSFCRKSYREVGPLVEGPADVYICGECIELCQSILDQERKRRGAPVPCSIAFPHRANWSPHSTSTSTVSSKPNASSPWLSTTTTSG